MPKFVNLIAFLEKLISKEHVVVIMEFLDCVQVKMKMLYERQKTGRVVDLSLVRFPWQLFCLRVFSTKFC